VDNVVIFPDNIISIEEEAFCEMIDKIYFVYGKNVKTVG